MQRLSCALGPDAQLCNEIPMTNVPLVSFQSHKHQQSTFMAEDAYRSPATSGISTITVLFGHDQVAREVFSFTRWYSKRFEISGIY